MKIVVFSDSHGNTKSLESIINRHKNDIDTYLFLGDGIESIDYLKYDFKSINIYAVKGNNDFSYYARNDYPFDRVLTFEGKNIFMTHGHKYSQLDMKKALKKKALEFKANVVLYGHIHIPAMSYDKINNILYICPGSTSLPRGGSEKSYVILDVSKDKNVSAEFMEV